VPAESCAGKVVASGARPGVLSSDEDGKAVRDDYTRIPAPSADASQIGVQPATLSRVASRRGAARPGDADSHARPHAIASPGSSAPAEPVPRDTGFFCRPVVVRARTAPVERFCLLQGAPEACSTCASCHGGRHLDTPQTVQPLYPPFLIAGRNKGQCGNARASPSLPAGSSSRRL
jgi:hypothetical protein